MSVLGNTFFPADFSSAAADFFWASQGRFLPIHANHSLHAIPGRGRKLLLFRCTFPLLPTSFNMERKESSWYRISVS